MVLARLLTQSASQGQPASWATSGLQLAAIWRLLMQKSSPIYKTLYSDVAEVKVIADDHVRFELKHNRNQELILIIGQLPVLPKHATQVDNFAESSLNIPIGSGPYMISAVNFYGTSNWEKGIPLMSEIDMNTGLNNYSCQINYEFIRAANFTL